MGQCATRIHKSFFDQGHIFLELPDITFNSGGTISGVAHLNLVAPYPCASLQFQLKGTEKVRWVMEHNIAEEKELAEGE